MILLVIERSEIPRSGIGYWLLVIGYWLLVIGYWLLSKTASREASLVSFQGVGLFKNFKVL